jgi:hypothetical protein
MSAHLTVGAEGCTTPTKATARLPSVRSSGGDSFEIVVIIPVGEDTQEAEQLLQNDDHDNDHGEEENNEEKRRRG